MTRKIAIAVSLLAALIGCQQLPVDSYCAVDKLITYSASGDTQETKNQIKEHNAVFRRLCR